MLTLEVTAATWDGARGGISVYAEGTVSFVLGGGSAGGVVKGLEEGVKEVPVGSKATITCAPSMAYGNAGAPPAVPPNSFVVLTITLVSAAPAPSPVPSPEGPALLLTGNIPSNRRGSAMSVRRTSGVILVSGGGEGGADAVLKPVNP